MHRMRCAEIWGGIRDQDTDVCSSGITASLYSRACDGGKGGDLYYFSVCESDMLTRIAIADVVGHGEAVSDVSGWLYGALESRMNDASGNEILAQLNGLTCDKGYRALTTAAIVAYYTADSHAYFSYAGHHAMVVYRKADGRWTEAKIDNVDSNLVNLPLGVDSNVAFTQGRVQLDAGDRMFLYTDGVIEASNGRAELFGSTRLMSILEECASCTCGEIKRAILTELRSYTGGQFSHDDVTLLAAEVQ